MIQAAIVTVITIITFGVCMVLNNYYAIHPAYLTATAFIGGLVCGCSIRNKSI